jgi:hypothetical protein
MKHAALAPVLTLAVALAAVSLLPTQNVSHAADDLDCDGLPDSLEQTLAERYAPVVLHDADEPNLPMDAATYIAGSELWYFDESCSPKARLVSGPFATIPDLMQRSCGAQSAAVSSFGSFSLAKICSFFLAPRDRSVYLGAKDTRRWVTYFHAYPSAGDGAVIQYWRFFAYNTSYFHGLHTWVGNHEGDWEAIHVVLGPKPAYAPQFIRLLGHSSISSVPWNSSVRRGTHPVISSAKGGHTSLLAAEDDLSAERHFVQETWTGGTVRLPRSGSASSGAPLVNLGEKTAPMRGMEFLRYSGLWGRRENGWFGAYNSGYWGPAFNETGRHKDGFVAAWCEDMRDPSRSAGPVRECYPELSLK